MPLEQATVMYKDVKIVVREASGGDYLSQWALNDAIVEGICTKRGIERDNLPNAVWAQVIGFRRLVQQTVSIENLDYTLPDASTATPEQLADAFDAMLELPGMLLAKWDGACLKLNREWVDPNE